MAAPAAPAEATEGPVAPAESNAPGGGETLDAVASADVETLDEAAAVLDVAPSEEDAQPRTENPRATPASVTAAASGADGNSQLLPVPLAVGRPEVGTGEKGGEGTVPSSPQREMRAGEGVVEGRPSDAAERIHRAAASTRMTSTEFSSSPREESSEEPVAVTEQTVCGTLGPLANERESARVAGMLEGRVQQVRQRVNEQERVTSWWIVVERPRQRDEKIALIERLRGVGVEDIWTIPAGEYEGLLSLGIYGSKLNAERALERAIAAGVNAELRPRTRGRRRRQYWVDVVLHARVGDEETGASTAAAAEGPLAALGPVPPGVSVEQAPCAAVAATSLSP